MNSRDHRLSIPRRDKPVDRTFSLPIGMKMGILIALAVFVVLSSGLLWMAFHQDATARAVVMGALGLVFAAAAYSLLSAAFRIWDRFHVSETGLTVYRPFGRVTSVSWEQIAEIRHRPVLKRFDLTFRGIEGTIRIEEQIGDFCDLLTIIAERTFHLLREDPAIATARPRVSWLRRRRQKPLVIGRDSITLGTDELGYAEVANIEFKQIGSSQQPFLVLLITRLYGQGFVVPLQGRDPVATYQRLRRAHLDHLDRDQLTPPEAPPVVTVGSGGAGWRMVGSVVASLVVILFFAFVRNPDLMERFSDTRDDRSSKRVWELFRAGRYEEVVELGGAQLEDREVDERTLNTAMLRAISLRRLGRNEEAIRGFEAALPAVRELNNVEAARFGEIFYDLAELYGGRGDIQRALETVQEGLRIRPQSATHQLLAAYWYERLADRDSAQARYREILPTLAAGSEGYVVAQGRLAALSGREPREGAGSVQREQVVHLSRRILLVPINQIDDRVDLADACLLVESKLELPCRVNPPFEIPEERITEGGRTLYHAGRIARLLYEGRRRASADVFVVGLTSHDMYDGDANFVFSTQYPELQVAVVSSYRLTERLPGYWDADVLATRRVVVQLLSAIGNGFGLDRPTRADCPLAFPSGLEAFMRKSHRLCESTRTQWREVLNVPEGRQARFDDVRLAALARAQSKYLMEPDG